MAGINFLITRGILVTLDITAYCHWGACLGKRNTKSMQEVLWKEKS